MNENLVSREVVNRANRYSRDELAKAKRVGTPREQDLAAVVLANLDVRASDAICLEERDLDLGVLKSKIKGMIEEVGRVGVGAGGAMFKIAPVLDVRVESFVADPVRGTVEFAVGAGDAPQLVAAFLDESLWLAAVAGGGDQFPK